HLDVIEDLPDDAFVIAADSGLDQARRLGIAVDLIIGDLDSVSARALAESEGIPIEQYPVDKNQTDLELALDAAARLDAVRIIVVGGHGGRLDHLLANAAALTNPVLHGRRVEWLAGRDHAYVVGSGVTVHGVPGQTVSLIPIGGPVTGVTTRGLRWELNDARLDAASARGISNLMTSPYASISTTGGCLFAILPG
ncbi:MAG: thiamine diphosphokinase, partial [Acidimicrobiia bacterium]|nr:thiamine diphosphokinase [Acidimicrobiia bacterium]